MTPGGATSDAAENFVEFIDAVNPYIHTATLVVLVCIACLGVIWGIWVGIRLAMAEDEGKRIEAKKQIMWSLIAILVVATMYVLLSTLLHPTTGVFSDKPKIEIIEDPDNPDPVVGEAAAVVKAISAAIDAVLRLLVVFALLYAIYLGFRLATASDEGKRREAKLQVFWTLVAVVIALALAMIITNVMLSVARAI